jgi:hypothetical protein
MIQALAAGVGNILLLDKLSLITIKRISIPAYNLCHSILIINRR